MIFLSKLVGFISLFCSAGVMVCPGAIFIYSVQDSNCNFSWKDSLCLTLACTTGICLQGWRNESLRREDLGVLPADNVQMSALSRHCSQLNSPALPTRSQPFLRAACIQWWVSAGVQSASPLSQHGTILKGHLSFTAPHGRMINSPRCARDSCPWNPSILHPKTSLNPGHARAIISPSHEAGWRLGWDGVAAHLLPLPGPASIPPTAIGPKSSPWQASCTLISVSVYFPGNPTCNSSVFLNLIIENA